MNINLDKKSKSVIAIYAIVLFVYIIAFLIVPFNKGVASWISFVFTIISMISSLFVCGCAFKSNDTLVSRIYGFPIFRVGVMYALIQLVLGIAICIIDAFIIVPYWIALLISVILLGVAAIGVIITDNTRDIIEDSDASIKIETKNTTLFQINIAGIVDMCEDAQIKGELEKLNEVFQFSDPVTSEQTEEIEETIREMLSELKSNIVDGNVDDIKKLIREITNILKERNRICKVGKG